ncbi:MAG: ABC transporter permease [Chloroflexi bacterium]|nr:ABC transporter permease [Chloroflexota bacterium]
MRRYLLRRLLFGLLSLVAVTALVFGLSRAAGDPILLYAKPGGYGITPERLEQLEKKLGLDKPLVVQYFVWLGRIVRGDFGNTIVTETPVKQLIRDRITPTLQLGIAAFVFSIMIGVPLGVLSAVKRGTVWDYLGRGFALFGQALPTFWTGIMAILVFSVILGWLPVGTSGPTETFPLSWNKIKFFLMPAITLGWLPAAAFLRLTRSAMLEVLDSEYIRFARSKGVSGRSVVWKHAFRNAMLQPLTLAAITLASFITGSVVAERIFAWPGVGQLTIQAVWNNDFPTLTGTVMLWTAAFVLLNFVADMAYGFFNPVIRYK